MSDDFVRRNTTLRLQKDDQFLQRMHLRRTGRSIVFEIANQTDADPVLVVFVIPGVRALNLFRPAVANFHLPIARAAAQLGLGVTVLKKYCRKMDLVSWIP